MLSFFYKNQCNYQRGQVASFFIVLLVILIIMALVTVNLSKVAFIKTESANAVDAGTLAGGAVMANLFNAIGKANRDLEATYREFFELISMYFVIAIDYLIYGYLYAYYAEMLGEEALAWACYDPCTAIFFTEWAMSNIQPAVDNLYDLIDIIEGQDDGGGNVFGIKPEVRKFYNDQQAYYRKIRKAADDAYKQSVKMCHRFAFMNSGIGLKLKDRGGLDSFLNNLSSRNQETYRWSDGQGRPHSVQVTVGIDKVDRFELKVTEFTYSEEMEYLNDAIQRAYRAIDDLYTAWDYYYWADFFLYLACLIDILFCIFAIYFLIEATYYNFSALQELKPLFSKLPAAWAGLLPKEDIFMSVNNGDAYDQIICWIEEIDHNRKVRVDTKQQHGARQEQGIWNARYPTTNSYSISNFDGKGQIHRPRGSNQIEGPILRHNPSIVETDKVNP